METSSSVQAHLLWHKARILWFFKQPNELRSMNLESLFLVIQIKSWHIQENNLLAYAVMGTYTLIVDQSCASPGAGNPPKVPLLGVQPWRWQWAWGVVCAAAAASPQHLPSPAPPPPKLTACPPLPGGTRCFQAIFSVREWCWRRQVSLYPPPCLSVSNWSPDEGSLQS